MTNGPPPIEVRGLRKVFRQTMSGQSVIAIDRLDLTIAPKEVIAIVGQTGCGKSTFFDLMIGLEQPTEGAILIGDKSPSTDFDYFRGKMATVFQQDRLLPWRSALDNAKLPLELIGLPEAEQRKRALTWLNRLGRHLAALRLAGAADGKPEAHVLPDRQPGEERGLLEDQAALGRRRLDQVAERPGEALGHLLQAGDEIEQGALAAAGRPQEDHELAGRDVEVDVAQGLVRPFGAGRPGLADAAADHGVPRRKVGR